MTPALRPYQRAAIDEALPLIAAGRHPIVTLPTGAGKTFTASQLIRELGRPTLWLAHRRELIGQAHLRIMRDGMDAGIIMAGHLPNPGAPVQVASIQTLARRSLATTPGLIVVDECHHATSPAYRRLFDSLPGVPRLGLTATPWRLDGKGLASAGFTDIVAPVTVEALCTDGTLIRPTVLAPSALDLSHVRTVAGEYDLAALADKCNQIVGDVVEHWVREANNAPTVCFAVDVDHSIRLRDRFRAAGVTAEHLDGETPAAERAALLGRLASGKVRVVTNCAVWTEGVDVPEIGCVIQARPTQSSCLHRQQIGRGMRQAPRKTSCLVLDHAGNFHRHGLVEWPVEFSLTGATRVRMSPDAPCIACGRVLSRLVLQCPHCGTLQREPGTGRPPRPAVREVAGQLVPVSLNERAAETRAASRPTTRTDIEKAWAAAQAIGRARGVSPAAVFKSKVGRYPLVVGGRLIHPDEATEADWEALRASWRRLGEGKGWAASKIVWFVRKCETEARQSAKPAMSATP